MSNTKPYTPQTKKTWAVILSSEFLGTIFLTWMIGLLGVSFSGEKFEEIISIGDKDGVNFVAVGFWLWLDIFLCLAIFSRWSCDLNPLVTTYKMLEKKESVKFGLIKIGVQMFAGLIAGLFIVATQAISHAVSHDAVDSIYSNANIGAKEFGNWASFTAKTPIQGFTHNHHAWSVLRHIIAFVGEMAGALILTWCVFNKSIKNTAIKDMAIALAIGVGVAALLPLGTVAWNPARLLGTQWVFDVFKGGHRAMDMFLTYTAGEFAGVFLFFGATKFMDWKGIELWEKWINLGKLKLDKTSPKKPSPKNIEPKATINQSVKKEINKNNTK